MRYFMESFDDVEFDWFILLNEEGKDIGFILLPTELCKEKVKTFCKEFVNALEEERANIGVSDSMLILTRSDTCTQEYIHCERRVIALMHKIFSSKKEDIYIFRVGEDGFGMEINEFLKIYLPESCYFHQRESSV